MAQTRRSFEQQVMDELFGPRNQISLVIFKILRKRVRIREDFEDAVIEFYLKARRLLAERPEARGFPARYWVRVALTVTDPKNHWLRPLVPVNPAADLFCNPTYVEAYAWTQRSSIENDNGQSLDKSLEKQR